MHAHYTRLNYWHLKASSSSLLSLEIYSPSLVSCDCQLCLVQLLRPPLVEVAASSILSFSCFVSGSCIPHCSCSILLLKSATSLSQFRLVELFLSCEILGWLVAEMRESLDVFNNSWVFTKMLAMMVQHCSTVSGGRDLWRRRWLSSMRSSTMTTDRSLSWLS